MNVYKEQGYTSFDVVAKLRGILKQKKIGHTGTLDPMAEGVLLVCLGQATKLADMLVEKNKAYRCCMLLGMTTDTEDITGTITGTCTDIPEAEKILDTIYSFKGTYEQLPPMYSAIKVNGKKLYELAREGIEVERQKRTVTIYDIVVESVALPRVTFTVSCSKGTYIRSLCRDIGEALSCGAVMEKLVRTEVKDFSVRDSLTLEQIENIQKEGSISNYIISMDTLLQDYPVLHILNDAQCIKLLMNGNKLYPGSFVENTVYNDTVVRVYDGLGEFRALYTYDVEKGQYVPYKMFL